MLVLCCWCKREFWLLCFLLRVLYDAQLLVRGASNVAESVVRSLRCWGVCCQRSQILGSQLLGCLRCWGVCWQASQILGGKLLGVLNVGVSQMFGCLLVGLFGIRESVVGCLKCWESVDSDSYILGSKLLERLTSWTIQFLSFVVGNWKVCCWSSYIFGSMFMGSYVLRCWLL